MPTSLPHLGLPLVEAFRDEFVLPGLPANALDLLRGGDGLGGGGGHSPAAACTFLRRSENACRREVQGVGSQMSAGESALHLRQVSRLVQLKQRLM